MTDITPKELHSQIQDFRKRISRGEEVTDEELRKAIRQLHTYRASAHTSLESASKKKAKTAVARRTKAEKTAAATAALGDLL